MTIEHFGIIFLAIGAAGIVKIIFFHDKSGDESEVDLDLKSKVLKAKGPGVAIAFSMIMGGVFASGGTQKMVDYLFTSEAAAASLGNVVANKRKPAILMSNITSKPIEGAQVFPYFNRERSNDKGEFEFNLPMRSDAGGGMNFIVISKGKKCGDIYKFFNVNEAPEGQQEPIWVDCE
jgi:hypothetical protein